MTHLEEQMLIRSLTVTAERLTHHAEQRPEHSEARASMLSAAQKARDAIGLINDEWNDRAP